MKWQNRIKKSGYSVWEYPRLLIDKVRKISFNHPHSLLTQPFVVNARPDILTNEGHDHLKINLFFFHSILKIYSRAYIFL